MMKHNRCILNFLGLPMLQHANEQPSPVSSFKHLCASYRCVHRYLPWEKCCFFSHTFQIKKLASRTMIDADPFLVFFDSYVTMAVRHMKLQVDDCLAILLLKFELVARDLVLHYFGLKATFWNTFNKLCMLPLKLYYCGFNAVCLREAFVCGLGKAITFNENL